MRGELDISPIEKIKIEPTRKNGFLVSNVRPIPMAEIKNPKIRNIDLSKLVVDINSSNKDNIEISGLRFSNREEVIRLKDAGLKKVYRIIINGEKPINKEKLKKAAQTLRDRTISQFTPSRVAHRRANTVREKKIYNCNIESVEDTIATLILEAESGTYIKELITGDDGKTRPNISEMIDVPCQVLELDVIEIKGE
jgi:tRNA pseudouridine synthase 10